MYVLVILGLTSFLLCLGLTPLLRNLFIWMGFVDSPDCDRKLHKTPVPRIGGVPIVISCVGSFVLLYLLFGDRGRLYVQHGQLMHAVIPAAAVVFAVGLLDDLLGLKPWQKLTGQMVASIVAISLGVRLASPHLSPVVSIAASFVWLICCSNAVNLIDGMDGLATGVSLLATLTTLAVALMYGRYGLALATVPLAGALLAFLRYNFSPASVFLGDCGSLTIGFLLGCFGLVWSEHTVKLVGLAAPLMALALPLTDVGLAVVRRFLRSAPIFKADRGHIHHRVLALGFSTSRAALLLYGVCCASAMLALVASMNQQRLGWPMLALFLVLLIYGINRLRFVEFSAARKLLSRSSLRRAVEEEVYLQEMRLALADAQSLENCWHVIRVTCRDLRFVSAQWKVDGASFREEFAAVIDGTGCDIELRVGHQSWLLLRHAVEEDSARMSMSVLNQLQSVIGKKLQELESSAMPVAVRSTAA